MALIKEHKFPVWSDSMNTTYYVCTWCGRLEDDIHNAWDHSTACVMYEEEPLSKWLREGAKERELL